MSKYVHIRLMLVVAAVLLLATASSAAVKVSPSNMQGWVLATVSSGIGQFTPCPFGNAAGPGALWLYCGGEGSTSLPPYPGQIWMGTNEYNGVRLDEVTELSYDTWTTNAGIFKSDTTLWYDRWSGPRQQCTMRLFIDPQDGSAQRVLFYRPRGADLAPYIDDTTYENDWVRNDGLGTGYWDVLDPSLPGTPGQFTHYGQSWSQLLTLFPNGRIVQPALQPAGGQWPEVNPPNSPNACGISLEWGAEMYGLNNTPFVPWKNWWRESLGGVSWADNVQIGLNGNDPTVYDFEPDKTAGTVTGNGVALRDLISYRSRHTFYFDPYGMVVARGAETRAEEFWLDDGRGPTRCYCIGNPVTTTGSYKRVHAFLVPGYSNRKSTEPVPNRFHTDIYGNIVQVWP